MGVGIFLRQWNVHSCLAVLLIAFLSLTLLACSNESESTDNETIDAGEPVDTTEPVDNNGSPGNAPENPSEDTANEDSDANQEENPPPSLPPTNLVIEQNIPEQFIVAAGNCFYTDNTLAATIDVYAGNIHLPISDPGVMLVQTVPVLLSAGGDYRYQLSFDQSAQYALILNCGSVDSQLSSVEQPGLLLMNVFVVDNAVGLALEGLVQPANHIDTNDDCAGCHYVNELQRIALLDYVDNSIDRCNICHDGNAAIGKTEGHVLTDQSCHLCHNSQRWTVQELDHTLVTGITCVECHQGTIASGKPASHIPSDDQCQACHEPAPATWVPLVPGAVDHAHVFGNCIDCHCSPLAIYGWCGTPLDHPITNLDCGVCHSSNAWLPLLVDHSLVSQTCVNCHNGTDASGKSANHINTSDNCLACHESPPVLWTPVPVDNVDHNEVIGSCSSCHSCVIAPCGIPFDHPPAVDDCGACHAPPNWLPLQVDHGLTTANCVVCHNGTDASGKSANHIPTTDVCEACHAALSAIWAPVYPGNVDHNHVEGSCIYCHDHVVGPAMPPLNHYAFSMECQACHSTDVWVPTKSSIDHIQVNGNCSFCHNGTIARGKGPAHFVTTEDCASCHSIEAWIPANLDHQSFSGDCISCHDGVTASGKPANHINSSDNCGSCHEPAPASWIPLTPADVDHNEVIGSCVSCHNGCAGICPSHRINTTDNCIACHNTNTWLPVDTVDHREVLGVCSDCHNGVLATGKSDTHLETLFECNVCHTTNNWLVN